MPNHFHLLIHQTDKSGVTNLMRRVNTGYAMYFNERYKRVGTLFQGKFKASKVGRDSYLHHASRYIHLNPSDFKIWPYSSLGVYSGSKKTKWVSTEPVLSLFGGSQKQYLEFVEDYVETKAERESIKTQLAVSIL